jgi:hypothetical protein
VVSVTFDVLDQDASAVAKTLAARMLFGEPLSDAECVELGNAVEALHLRAQLSGRPVRHVPLTAGLAALAMGWAASGGNHEVASAVVERLAPQFERYEHERRGSATEMTG